MNDNPRGFRQPLGGEYAGQRIAAPPAEKCRTGKKSHAGADDERLLDYESAVRL